MSESEEHLGLKVGDIVSLRCFSKTRGRLAKSALDEDFQIIHHFRLTPSHWYVVEDHESPSWGVWVLGSELRRAKRES